MSSTPTKLFVTSIVGTADGGTAWGHDPPMDCATEITDPYYAPGQRPCKIRLLHGGEGLIRWRRRDHLLYRRQAPYRDTVVIYVNCPPHPDAIPWRIDDGLGRRR
jgi:hypothetical protein